MGRKDSMALHFKGQDVEVGFKHFRAYPETRWEPGCPECVEVYSVRDVTSHQDVTLTDDELVELEDLLLCIIHGG